MEIRELTTPAELALCEEIQRRVWGLPDTEVVPVAQMSAALHAGGFLAGAWEGSALLGFSFGFPAYRPEREPTPGLHSHMTAVLREARGRGLGRSLKWHQRRWCLDRGIDWVEWTFDPLRARNARLNLEHLGAHASEYLVDAYGPMQDSLNAGLPSDRLVAVWRLASEEVTRLEQARQVRQVATGHDPRLAPSMVDRSAPGPAPRGSVAQGDLLSAAVPALQADVGGLPAEPRLGLDDDTVTVAVPDDLSALLATAPDQALRWRLAVRDALVHYFDRGYAATRFLGGAYLLQKTECKDRP